MQFTDQNCITIDDVVAIDPDVLEVATVEEIPTEGQGSFIYQAIQETANKLLSEFQQFNYPYFYNQILSNNLLVPVDSTPLPRVRLGQVCMDSLGTTTFTSPLKIYITYLALRNFYQIASNRKLDDKYDAKRKQLEQDLRNKYWAALKQSGLPIVSNPIPCPGAEYELNQGIWNESNISLISGSLTPATYDVSITWTRNGIESAPSIIQTIEVATAEQIHIDITSLQVPNEVTSWNVYASLTSAIQHFQASVPIATLGYALNTVSTSGKIVGRGQSPDTNLTFINLFSMA